MHAHNPLRDDANVVSALATSLWIEDGHSTPPVREQLAWSALPESTRAYWEGLARAALDHLPTSHTFRGVHFHVVPTKNTPHTAAEPHTCGLVLYADDGVHAYLHPTRFDAPSKENYDGRDRRKN